MHLSEAVIGIIVAHILHALSTHAAKTTITGDKMIASTFTDGHDATLIAYQSADTSIISLTGAGPAGDTSRPGYTPGTIVGAGIARNDTPLAFALQHDDSGATIPHLFYLSAETCERGTELREAYRDPTRGWLPGSLNDQHICSSDESNLLYALWYTGQGNGPISPLRVGYMAAKTGLLSEVWFSANGWVNSAFL